MGRLLGLPGFWTAIVIGTLGVSVQAFTTREQQFTASYSSIDIEYGTYGRVYITHYDHGYHRYELCSNGFSYWTGENLCRSKGYSYNSYTTTSPNNPYATVDMHCYDSSSYYGCDDVQPRSYCSTTIYIHCSEYSTTEETSTAGTERSTTEYLRPGYSNIAIEYGTYGRVFIGHGGYEVCYDSYNYNAGQALCGSQGYQYSSYSSSYSPYDRYRTVKVQCYTSDIYSCTFQILGYCSHSLHLYCSRLSTETETPESTMEMTTLTSQTFTVGYSSVDIEYGTYGRVYINHYDYGYHRYELCYSGYSSRTGESLCRSKGYQYNYYTTSNPRDSYNTVTMNCYGSSLADCYVQSRGYCSSIVYIHCHEETTAGIEVTTVEYLHPGYSNVTIEYGTHGRVYIGQGRYEVCYSSFNINAGQALCRSKGYGYTTYTQSSLYNPYRTVDVQCYSSYIYSCTFQWRGYCSNLLYLYCHEPTTESYDTSTISYSTETYTNVRLVGGDNDRGRIEVFHNGQWGTICDDSFDNSDGDVICRMLGFNFSRQTFSGAYFGQGSGPIWLDDLNCYGNEGDISECGSRGWGQHNCGHSEDAGVYCEVRLVGSGYHDRGTIEVFYNGKWGTICDDSFDKLDGDVICRMLGYNSSRTTYDGAYFGQGSGPIWLDDLSCRGYEGDVSECGSRGWGSHNCGHGEDAGVYCVNDTMDYETTTVPYDPCSSSACYNGGTCVPRYSGYPDYTCRCAYGYTGSHCQYYATTRSDPCQSYPCHNGGTCYTNYAYYRNYYCSCPYRYSGQNCDYYVAETTTYDPCYTNPCRHGGTCYSNYGYPGYYCTCANGYSGRDCESSTGFSPDGVITVGCNDNQWDLAVYLPPLYSRYPDFNPNDLYLGQDSCSGYVDGNYLRFRSDYTTCGTATITSTNNIAYTNEIIYALHDPNHHFIIREYRFRVPVDCYAPRNEGGSGHIYHGHDITLPPSHHVTGSSHHTVHLQFYTDSAFQHPKSLYGSKVGDTIYVKAFTDVRDYNLKMRLSDCYSTPTSDKYSSMKYYIIKNGCVIDPNARIMSQSTHETRFYFQDFEFSTNRDSLYLHCNATFCKSNDYSASCEQACHHKRLGGGDIVFDGPLEGVAVNEAVRLTSAKTPGSQNQKGSSTLLLVISLVFGVVILVMIIAMVAGKMKRSKQRGQEEVKTI